MAVVLPDPAGAMASCTRRPQVASWRTRWAWAVLRVIPLATDSSSATSTSTSLAARPPRRVAASSRYASSASTASDVYSRLPATSYTLTPSRRRSTSGTCTGSPLPSGIEWVGFRTAATT